jgi:glycosyltransferase involved in cell wall biosynthesis
MDKRFSVVIEAYNRENYIRQTIDSVLSQTFKDYEIIVVDDGSTDRTQEVLKTYDDRIRYIRQANQGSEATFRKGASLATGEYLAFLDSDDLFMPCALSTYDAIIKELDAPPLIVGSMIRFRDDHVVQEDAGNKQIIEVLKYRDYLSKEIGMGMVQSIIVMRRTTFEEISGARDKSASPYLFNYDYNLILQAGTHGPCVIVKRPVTVAYRQHESQNSSNVIKMVQGVLSLIRMVRSGRSFGGWSRLLAKCAYLGGPVYEWSRKAINQKRFWLAFTLLMNGWPMVLIAALRKFSLYFRRPTAPLIIELNSRETVERI